MGNGPPICRQAKWRADLRATHGFLAWQMRRRSVMRGYPTRIRFQWHCDEPIDFGMDLSDARVY
jgi:hypothetical protein